MGDATRHSARSHLSPGTVPAGRIYFCHHFTRDLVWRDEWRHHANGAVAVARAVIAARDPQRSGDCSRACSATMRCGAAGSGYSLAIGLSRFDVITPADLAREFGDAAPAGDGRDEYMAALTIRTRSLERAAAALATGQIGGVRRDSRTHHRAGYRDLRRDAGISLREPGQRHRFESIRRPSR